MINVSKILQIVFSALFNNIQPYSITANINGTQISLNTSYSNGTLTLQGEITFQNATNSLTINIYINQCAIDSILLNVNLNPGTYTFVYTITIDDSTGIINNTFGYAVTNQLKSVSISTNASSYTITIIQNMLTFYLSYTSYPTSVSITVTLTLMNGNTVTGNYSNPTPVLSQGTTLYGTMIPVTFEL